MGLIYAVAGAAIALAGGDKLAGNRAYKGMFRHLGWTRRERNLAAAAEVAGGMLMVPRASRRLGGGIVAAVSASVLASEMRHGDTRLAAFRGLVLVAGLAALTAPGED